VVRDVADRPPHVGHPAAQAIRGLRAVHERITGHDDVRSVAAREPPAIVGIGSHSIFWCIGSVRVGLGRSNS